MKIWLDDLRKAPEGWQVVRTIEQAKALAEEAMRADAFEACSLDHDLGQGDDKDGIYFVDWMAQTGNWPQQKPQVHSRNAIGRQRMERTIERYWPGRDRERYFVVNHFKSKGGFPRAELIRELDTKEEAEQWVEDQVLWQILFTGEAEERFEVFVGSRNALDRHLSQFKPGHLGDTETSPSTIA